MIFIIVSAVILILNSENKEINMSNSTQTLIKLLSNYRNVCNEQSMHHDSIFNGIDNSITIIDSNNEKGEIIISDYGNGHFLTEFENKTVKVSINELEEGIYSFSDVKQGEVLLKRTKMMHELTLKLRVLRDDIEDFAVGKKVKNNKGEVGTIVRTHDDGCVLNLKIVKINGFIEVH